jgi:hypothetical protein
MALSGAAALALCAGGAAWAAEAGYPKLRVSLPAEVEFDTTVDADDPLAEISDLYLTVEPDVAIGLNPWATFELGLVFEPVLDPVPGRDRTLRDHGLFAEKVQFVGEFGRVTLNAGKFQAPFSIGTDYTLGLYGDTFAEEIEVKERWGLGAAYNVSGEGLEKGVILRGAIFTRDTTFLSGSAFENRGRLSEADGGAGNTESLENLAVALDLLDLDSLPDVHVRVAYMYQAAGLGDLSDQNAFAAAAKWEKEIGGGVYQVLAEWAHSDGAIGFGEAVSVPGASQDNLSLAVAGTWNGKWTASAGVGLRDVEDPVGGDVEAAALHLSAGYYVTEDILAQAAYLAIQEEGNDSHTLGLVISTSFDWEAH